MQCQRAGAEGEEMTKPPNIRADVESWIASESTDKVADYASRGRKHQNLSDLDLVTAWQTAFKRMADDVRDYDRRGVEEDYKSEFSLRHRQRELDIPAWHLGYRGPNRPVGMC
jgi:hypothetical protein